MTDINLEEIKNRVAATSEPLPDDAQLNAYYYGFDKTNCGPIDAVLSAVAVAGKGAHNTIDWNNTDTYGYYKDRAGLPPNPESALDLIELTAKASAEKVSAAVEDVAATHAGYTSHGHPIAGLKQSGKPSSVMRCGGPSICARCALEASRATRSEDQQ